MNPPQAGCQVFTLARATRSLQMYELHGVQGESIIIRAIRSLLPQSSCPASFRGPQTQKMPSKIAAL
jgi:hypothetical protein